MIRFLAAALIASAALTGANAITVYSTPSGATPSNFNGFEGMGAQFTFTGPYSEDGITAEYIGSGSIWTTSQAAEGLYSWYPNGGGNGYTQLSFAPSTGMEVLVGSGWFGGAPLLAYEILSGGNVIATGAGIAVPSYQTGFVTFGVTGGTFDTVRLKVTTDGALRFDPNSYEAGAFDAVQLFGVVPEPATWAMLIAGFGLVGFAARRRSRAVAA
ncbi:PEPxxWA-CTERM sorting domain-containing protein [Sandaracinobacteroides saxicola]|uniref:PEPxxWA-CTERM sorting domain-containing protein n=1 Tax=Sandaracinobacteroides saxicola TaxID=2759707 RepID=A0A7G5ILM2_9SPHN|nr:PEPxxWA-CTERM sorting domain-containing protein [Sandaracinobacteroides saxicola]QMW24264.1 PEPxxWA-CTERM sorting domain-containing protein [Sandaracinobacteroides saxicola]